MLVTDEAVLTYSGDCGSVDFETKMYSESMDVLEHHIKPIRAMPGVVLEQTYLNKMTEGLKPLAVLATTSGKCSHMFCHKKSSL